MSDKPASKPGRPKTDSPKRNRVIRATDEEFELWIDAAGDQALAVWIRGILNRAAKRQIRKPSSD